MKNLSIIFNDDDENYFKIKIEDSLNENHIKNLLSLLHDLNISDNLESESEVLSAKYKDWIGRHEFFRNDDFIFHIIFENNFLHLILKCSLQNRQKFIEALHRLFDRSFQELT